MHRRPAGGRSLPASTLRELGRLRPILARAGYDERGLDERVRGGDRLSAPEGLAALRLRPEADEPASVLVRLFLAGETLDEPLVAAALAPLAAPDLPELLSVRDGTVRARVRLEPFDGLVVASDPPRRLRSAHVVGVGVATKLLAAVTVRRRVESALDLCTGSGALALLAARHAERVVGVDLNPRALRLAQVNAALNGVANVEWLAGDLFEPVTAETFDLVVANPPFIVSPDREFLYRDGGQEDDALSRAVVEGAAARLRDGGFAHILCSWIPPARGDWSKPLRAWVRASGCDALLLRQRDDSPAAYALRWNLRPGGTYAAAAAAAERWLDYYAARGIEAIATGLVILRRRSGRNWVRTDELPRMPIGAAGGHVERVFAAEDLLRALPDERELLALKLVAAPRTMLVERREPSGTFKRGRLAVEEGLPLPGRLSEACLEVVRALDGTRSLGEAVDLARGRAGDSLVDECLPAIRTLLANGLLVCPTTLWSSS